MTDLIDTTEMYLRTILDLEEENIVPLRARIAERLAHSGPTVSQTVARMERDGLVVVSGDRHLELTEFGRKRAIEVMRKHRLAERLLHDVIGLEWEYIHEEACRWEHVMSEQVERKLFTLLDKPTKSPYGNPIPGLEELGGESQELSVGDLKNLVTATDDPGQPTFVIRRFGEPIQTEPETLAQLKEGGVLPGKKATLSRVGEYIEVRIDGVKGSLELPPEMARHIFVEAVDEG